MSSEKTFTKDKQVILGGLKPVGPEQKRINQWVECGPGKAKEKEAFYVI